MSTVRARYLTKRPYMDVVGSWEIQKGRKGKRGEEQREEREREESGRLEGRGGEGKKWADKKRETRGGREG